MAWLWKLPIKGHIPVVISDCSSCSSRLPDVRRRWSVLNRRANVRSGGFLIAIPPERYPAPLRFPPADANSIFFFFNPPAILSGRISVIASCFSRVSLPVVHRFFFTVGAVWHTCSISTHASHHDNGSASGPAPLRIVARQRDLLSSLLCVATFSCSAEVAFATVWTKTDHFKGM